MFDLKFENAVNKPKSLTAIDFKFEKHVYLDGKNDLK